MEHWFAAASALATASSTTTIGTSIPWSICLSSGVHCLNQSWIRSEYCPIGDWKEPTFTQFTPRLKWHMLWAWFVRPSALFIIEVDNTSCFTVVMKSADAWTFLAQNTCDSMQERNVQASALFVTCTPQQHDERSIDTPEVQEYRS